MRIRKWIFVAVPLGAALFVAIGGELVLQLWNWLLPALFGCRQITFWQALGVLALCRILFGGWGGRGPHGYGFRKRMADRCARMTPEEREKLHQRIHGRWGTAAATESKPDA